MAKNKPMFDGWVIAYYLLTFMETFSDFVCILFIYLNLFFGIFFIILYCINMHIFIFCINLLIESQMQLKQSCRAFIISFIYLFNFFLQNYPLIQEYFIFSNLSSIYMYYILCTTCQHEVGTDRKNKLHLKKIIFCVIKLEG